jgi:hypothetical protein
VTARLSTISVLSAGVAELFERGPIARYPHHRVGSLFELRDVLDGLPDGSGRTLDLSGHARRGTNLLALGATTLDMLDRRVERFFARLAADRVLVRLGIVQVRLLGCETAVCPSGQRTIRRLVRTLGVPVYGSRKRLMNAHYDGLGFDPCFAHLLVESAQLPHPPSRLPRLGITQRKEDYT